MALDEIVRQNNLRRYRDASEVLKGIEVMRGGMKNRADMVKLYDQKSRERDDSAKKAGL